MKNGILKEIADIEKGMVMCYPATRWEDAIPCGNGSVGALVYGNIKNEIIVLNHEALFLPSPKPELQPVYDPLTNFAICLWKDDMKKGYGFLWKS